MLSATLNAVMRWTRERLFQPSETAAPSDFHEAMTAIDELVAAAAAQRGLMRIHEAAAISVIRHYAGALGIPVEEYAGCSTLGQRHAIETAVIDDLQLASQGDRQSASRYLHGAIAISKGRPEEALRILDRRGQADGMCHFARSQALALAGRLEEAVAAARCALEVLPGMTAAHAHLADLLRRCGKGLEASRHDLLALQYVPFVATPRLRFDRATLREIGIRFDETGRIVRPEQASRKMKVWSVTLIEEGVHGFNIVLFDDLYYAVPQSFGPVELQDLLARRVRSRRAAAGPRRWPSRVIRRLLRAIPKSLTRGSPKWLKVYGRRLQRRTEAFFAGPTVDALKAEIARQAASSDRRSA